MPRYMSSLNEFINLSVSLSDILSLCSLIKKTFLASRVRSTLFCCFPLIHWLLHLYSFYYIYSHLLLINSSFITLKLVLFVNFFLLNNDFFQAFTLITPSPPPHPPPPPLSGSDSCLVNNVEWEAKSVGTFVTDYHLLLTHSDWQPPVIGQAFVWFHPYSKIHPNMSAVSCIPSRGLSGRLNGSDILDNLGDHQK